MQHELIRVLYPVFIHCFMDLVAKGHIQEGMLKNLCIVNYSASQTARFSNWSVSGTTNLILMFVIFSPNFFQYLP